MASNILEVLHNYKFDNPSDLHERLEHLSPLDWLNFSNSLDSFYSNIDSAIDKRVSSPLSFCFPSLPDNDLHKLSTYLLIADKVFLDDPLYDVASMLGGMANPEYTKRTPLTPFVYRKFRKELVTQAANCIFFYLKTKELVQEKKLLPFKVLSLPDGADIYANHISETFLNDSKLRKYFQLPHPIYVNGLSLFFALKFIYRAFKKDSLNKIFDEILNKDWVQKNALATFRLKPMVVSLAIFALYGGLQGFSIDFITPEYAYIFRKLLETASHENSKLPPDERLLIPGNFSVNPISVPLLQNIPLERVLDTISIESMAFDSFRATLNEKLLKINAPAGSIDREKQIAEIRETMNKDLANISIAYNEIKTSFSRKFSFHVIIGILINSRCWSFNYGTKFECPIIGRWHYSRSRFRGKRKRLCKRLA